jgi:ferredoxin
MKINKENCMACMMCIEACEFGAIDADMKSDSKGYKGAIIDEELCTNCGACVEVCPANCIGE